jgi:hypothetical protein
MKKFLVKISFMFISLASVIGIIILIPLPENAYDFAMIDKHRILAGTKSPKIVLAGGSNLAFGVDSAEIQKELNIPVVNTGLHIGFGLGRILDDISPFLNPGDILLIAPEYSHFSNVWNGNGAAYELIFDVRQYRLLWSPFYGLPNGFISYLSTHLRVIIQKYSADPLTPFAYSRNGFNKYGDFLKHLNMENQPFSSSDDLGLINRAYLKRFFHFVDNFARRGITVVLSYPCYEEQSFRNSAGFIQEIDTAFRAKKNLLVISNPASYCFPVNYFFDNYYHLNQEGRPLRTKQLIQDLQASGLFTGR